MRSCAYCGRAITNMCDACNWYLGLAQPWCRACCRKAQVGRGSPNDSQRLEAIDLYCVDLFYEAQAALKGLPRVLGKKPFFG